MNRLPKIWNPRLAMLLGAAFLAGAAVAGDDAELRQGDAYPLDICIVSGEKLGSMGDPVVKLYEGREVRFCCKGCVGGFEKETDSYLEKIDAMIVEQQLESYPMDACLVMGDEKLEGEDAEPVNYVYGNRLVRFCCKGCIRKFKKDPATYLSALDEAVIARDLESYPMQVCVVGGGKLGSMGEPVNYVFANRLVRFCCKGCVGSFDENPTEYMARIGEGK